MDKIRFFPVALYLFVCGAAGLGFGVGQAFEKPSFTTFFIILVCSPMTLAGWFMTRPYMRLARAAIKELAQLRLQEQQEKARAQAAGAEAE